MSAELLARYSTPPSSPSKHTHTLPPCELLSPPKIARVASQNGIRKNPPSAPSRPNLPSTDPISKKALAIASSLSIEANGSTHLLELLPGMKGHHSQLYRICSETPLVPGIPNENLYIKIFHEEAIQKHGRMIPTMMQNSLNQYQALQGKLPTIQIYNASTAKNDGYFVVQKVAPLPTPWTNKKSLASEDMALLEQIQKFFEFSWNDPSTLPLDLQRYNLGIDGEKVVLLDFMEHAEDELYAFRLIARSRIKSIAAGNFAVAQFLQTICPLDPPISEEDIPAL